MATSNRVLRRLGWVATGSLLALALLPGSMLAGGAPEYAISVDKTANPTTVAAKGASVTYTVAVENTGSGFFQVVVINDPDCTTWSAPTGDGGQKGKLEAGETWSYTCTTTVVPPKTNTVTVNACHDGSIDQCNQANHNATDSDSATVGVAGTTATSGTTLPPTDSISGTSGTADSIGLVLLALAGILASVMILTPARLRRR